MCPLEAVENALRIQSELQRANGEAPIQTIKRKGSFPAASDGSQMPARGVLVPLPGAPQRAERREVRVQGAQRAGQVVDTEGVRARQMRIV